MELFYPSAFVVRLKLLFTIARCRVSHDLVSHTMLNGISDEPSANGMLSDHRRVK